MGTNINAYFQDHCSADEILRWMPVLTREELAVIERYYRENQAALDEQDRRIRERTEERMRLQRLRFPEPEGTIEERRARLREKLGLPQTANGDGHPG